MKEIKADRTFKILCENVRNHYGIDFIGKEKPEEQVLIRATIMVIMVKHLGYTTTRTGQLFRRHHTTVVHHVQEHSAKYLYNKSYADIYDVVYEYAMAIAPSTSFDADDIISKMKKLLSV